MGSGELPVFRNPVITTGSYDGVHRGHRHIIDLMKQRADALEGETVVVTFADHPRRVLNSENGLRLLTTPDEKIALLAAAGVDNLLVMPFDAAVGQLSPEEFVAGFLVGKLGAREVVAGYNHRFGRGGGGDAALLRELGRRYGFGVTEAERFGGAEKVSSTAIRRLIGVGDMRHAAELLGHPYLLIADIAADGTLAAVDPLKLLPPPGEYPVTADGVKTVLEIAPDGPAALRGNASPRSREKVSISF